MDYLGEFELLVMLAVLRLGTNAYGMTICREIVEVAERSASLGAVYTTLERLEDKGFFVVRGGRANRRTRWTGQEVFQGYGVRSEGGKGFAEIDRGYAIRAGVGRGAMKTKEEVIALLRQSWLKWGRASMSMTTECFGLGCGIGSRRCLPWGFMCGRS